MLGCVCFDGQLMLLQWNKRIGLTPLKGQTGVRLADPISFYLGCIALIIGVSFYLFINPQGIPYLQQKLSLNLPLRSPGLWKPLWGEFPEFINPFALSLIGIGLLSTSKISRFLICFAFLLLNIFFEAGQYYKDVFIKYIPNWFDLFPILENAKHYFIKGTFTSEDLISIVSGSVLAFACAELISSRKEDLCVTKE